MAIPKAPIRKGPYDEWLEKFFDSARKSILETDDDRVYLLIGEPGAGKSHLALWVLDSYLGERASPSLIGLDKITVARALKESSEMELPRACLLDEANFSKRDSMSKFNKRIIDLFLANRGLQTLHIWATPSVDMLDRHFVDERLSGVFFVLKVPELKHWRLYFYFNKEALFKLRKDKGDLKLPTFKKHKNKYGTFRGWFREYKGHLIEPYLIKKKERMLEKNEEFYQDFGNPVEGEYLSTNQMCDYLGVAKRTFRDYCRELTENGLLKEDLNFYIKPSGRKMYKTTLKDDFATIARTRSANRFGGGGKDNGKK